jgi:hypothetical protein
MGSLGHCKRFPACTKPPVRGESEGPALVSACADLSIMSPAYAIWLSRVFLFDVRRTDVDGIEMLQLFGERRRPKGPVTANVHSSDKTTSPAAASFIVFFCVARFPPILRPPGRGK